MAARLRTQSSSTKSALAPPSTSSSTKESAQVASSDDSLSNGSTPPSAILDYTIFDYAWPLSLVFGGCCTNAWAHEELIVLNPRIGVTITFSQMAFIALQLMPSFLELRASASTSDSSPRPSFQWSRIGLKPRHVPLRHWALQVAVFIAGALLNNRALAYRLPFTLQILFRSAGMAISMLLNWLFMRQKYSIPQILSVVLVSVGVVLATLSKPAAPAVSRYSSAYVAPTSPGAKSPSSFATAGPTPTEYAIGITMFTISLLLTGVQGILQYRVFSRYGPHWKEGMFYTHIMSLPVFLLYRQDISLGLRSLSRASMVPYAILVFNLASQLACTSGVHQLGSQYRMSPVSINLVTTARKALSLCFSMWWFGSGWNTRLFSGAALVFAGSFTYTRATARTKDAVKKRD